MLPGMGRRQLKCLHMVLRAHSLLGLESLPLMLACSMVFQANSPDSRSVLAGAQEHPSCPVLLMTILFGWWHLLLWG